MLDTVSQQFMVGIGGWEIIKHHDTWIDTQEINMGGSSKARHHLILVDARGVAKICLDGKRYLVIFRQAFSNPNSDEVLLTEDQINCFGVKVYSHPRVFGGKQLIYARYQVERSVKLGISWDGSTRYFDVSPPTR